MRENIYVFQRSHNGVIHLMEEYNSPEDFANKYNEYKIDRDFRDDDSIRVRQVDLTRKLLDQLVFAKVAKNARDKIVPVSQLIGYCRSNRKKYICSWDKIRDRGGKKSAYGRFRRMKHIQEKKWTNAWDDEEFAPRIRAARSIRNLPDPWDDRYSDGQKSWKKQSKRKHQYKEKKNNGVYKDQE